MPKYRDRGPAGTTQYSWRKFLLMPLLCALFITLAGVAHWSREEQDRSDILEEQISSTPQPREFPTDPDDIKKLVEGLRTTCEEVAEADQPYSQAEVRIYKQQLLETAPRELVTGPGCILHSLLLHCPVDTKATDQSPMPSARSLLAVGNYISNGAHLLRQGVAFPPSTPSWGDFKWILGRRDRKTANRGLAKSILRLQGQASQTNSQIEDARLHEALEQGLRHRITSSPKMLKQATRHWGSPARLQAVLRKIVRGDKVTVVAVGGSVTTGMGAQNKNDAYANRIVEWLKGLGAADSPARIEYVNSAVSATTSSYTSQCLQDFVPPEVDLVLVEFSVNDWEALDAQNLAWMDNSLRRGFERLLRKLLGMKSNPAILLLHWWAPVHFKSSFWNVAEDELDTIGSYYDLQSISYRNAMFKPIMMDQPGYQLEETVCDIVHPNALGHRYFADLVIGYLQQVLADAILASSDYTSESSELPIPLFSGNEAQGTAICLKGEELKGAVVKMMGNWKWVNEVRQSALKPRLGYVSDTIGDELTLKLSHSKEGGGWLGQGGANSSVLVGLGLLKSYEGMGAAAVACSEDCTCDPQVFQLQHKQKVYWEYLLVHSPHIDDCHVTVRVMESSDKANEGTKVKVASLMVSEDMKAESENIFSILKSIDAEGDNSGRPKVLWED